jgi:hypothetical protein
VYSVTGCFELDPAKLATVGTPKIDAFLENCNLFGIDAILLPLSNPLAADHIQKCSATTTTVPLVGFNGTPSHDRHVPPSAYCPRPSAEPDAAGSKTHAPKRLALSTIRHAPPLCVRSPA